jgi:predicted transcriptional regulator
MANLIKLKRKELGITQVDLSQKSGLGLTFIRECEQGKRPYEWTKLTSC